MYQNNSTKDNSGQIPSYVRRGHTRKPNAIVRGIYWIADWLGDFGPLLSTTMRGAGHVSAFAGYSLLLIVTLAITIFIVVTSAMHSLELLHWIGFSDWTAYPTLFVVEAIFLIGSIQIDIAFKHGKYFPIPPILGFTAGLAFVLASNVMGLANNIGGLLFGIATPILLIIAKAMLAWQYTFKAKIATQSIEEKPPAQVDEINTEHTEEKPDELIEENQPSKLLEPTTTEDGNTPEQPPEITTEKTDVENVDEMDELVKNETTVEHTENKDESVSEEVAEKTTKKSSKTVAKKKPTKKKKTTVKVDDLTIEKIARDLEKENGELPGRKLLAQVAKCTEYKARIILSKMEPSPPEPDSKPKLTLAK